MRQDVQEYPNKVLKEAVMGKLKDADTDDIIDRISSYFLGRSVIAMIDSPH
jgi:hypothetical protein